MDDAMSKDPQRLAEAMAAAMTRQEGRPAYEPKAVFLDEFAKAYPDCPWTLERVWAKSAGLANEAGAMASILILDEAEFRIMTRACAAQMRATVLTMEVERLRHQAMNAAFARVGIASRDCFVDLETGHARANAPDGMPKDMPQPVRDMIKQIRATGCPVEVIDMTKGPNKGTKKGD